MATKIHSLIVAAALSLPFGLPLAQEKSIDKSVELSEPTLYDFLLGEIALQRGDLSLAARTYLDLARRTRDPRDRKSTRLNSSHGYISYAVFCLKKKSIPSSIAAARTHCPFGKETPAVSRRDRRLS